MPRKFQPPSVCPICGEDVPRNAKACPECGADEETGWKEGADVYDGIDLPEEDEFDYDKFVAEEFGGTPKRSTRQTFWWIVAIAVLAAFVWLSLR